MSWILIAAVAVWLLAGQTNMRAAGTWRRRIALNAMGPTLAAARPSRASNAPDLTIAGAYDPASFKTLMRTGVPPGARKLKLMSDIARASLSHMADAEIGEVHAYLVARAQRLTRWMAIATFSPQRYWRFSTERALP